MRPLSYVVILCLLIFTGAVLTSAQPVQSGGEPVLFNGVPAPEKYLAPPQEFLDIGKDSETGPSENPMLAPQVNAERLDPPGLQRSPDPESGMEDLMEKLSEGQENRKDPPGTDQADIIPFPDIMPYPEPETQDAKSLVSSPQDE
ncbi:MAG: hypothetical protein U1D99_03905, partial [Candidatus Omnitrophota bacterium]|nr:hypothetical protein [Candidatus Omnitrophota bacterium]